VERDLGGDFSGISDTAATLGETDIDLSALHLLEMKYLFCRSVVGLLMLYKFVERSLAMTHSCLSQARDTLRPKLASGCRWLSVVPSSLSRYLFASRLGRLNLFLGDLICWLMRIANHLRPSCLSTLTYSLSSLGCLEVHSLPTSPTCSIRFPALTLAASSRKFIFCRDLLGALKRDLTPDQNRSDFHLWIEKLRF
jgi:hypothetical protein